MRARFRSRRAMCSRLTGYAIGCGGGEPPPPVAPPAPGPQSAPLDAPAASAAPVKHHPRREHLGQRRYQ